MTMSAIMLTHTFTQSPWLTHWLWTYYHALVQQLSSEIKLRICTAPSMTKYPNSPPSWAWSKITEGTLILIIVPTMGRPVSGLDMRIRYRIGWSYDHQIDNVTMRGVQ